jgi:hypothetical protein
MVPMVGWRHGLRNKVRWKVMRILSKIYLSRNFLARRIKNRLNSKADSGSEMGWLCESIHNLMLHWKSSNKNRSVMLKHTKLNPTLNVITRWTSAGNMFTKFMRTVVHLVEASKHKDANLSIPRNVKFFKANASTAKKCLDDVNCCVRDLQTQHFSVSECHQALDGLIKIATDGSNDITSHWHLHELPTTYIAPTSKKQPHLHFYNGIVKLQNNQPDKLSRQEKEALKKAKFDVADDNDLNGATSYEAF